MYSTPSHRYIESLIELSVACSFPFSVISEAYRCLALLNPGNSPTKGDR